MRKIKTAEYSFSQSSRFAVNLVCPILLTAASGYGARRVWIRKGPEGGNIQALRSIRRHRKTLYAGRLGRRRVQEHQRGRQLEARPARA